MPLSDESQTVLRVLDERGVPPLDSMPPEEARVFFNEVFRTPDEDRAPIARVEDRELPGPGGPLPVRIYDAAKSAGPAPAILHFHGGGWVFGDLETHDGFCRDLAGATGAIVVAVDYRTAPAGRFPGAAEDCYAALCWVAEHAATLGVDGSRLGVTGDSAGGNLAAAVALMTRDRGGPPLRVQSLTYPAVDASMSAPSVDENADGYFLTKSSMDYFWGHYRGDDGNPDDPYLSPLRASSFAGLPPACIVTAGYDPLRDEGEAYADRLEAAGVAVSRQRYDSVFHGFMLMAKLIPEAALALAFEAEFIRKHL